MPRQCDAGSKQCVHACTVEVLLGSLLLILIAYGQSQLDLLLQAHGGTSGKDRSPTGLNSLFNPALHRAEVSPPDKPMPTSGAVMKMRTYLVEDNPTIRENLISTLEELAPVKTIGTAESEEEGVKWLTHNKNLWDLAIVDLFLKGGSGLGIVEACQNRRRLQKMVVFSNYATKEMRSRCAQLGVDAVFDKSTEIEALVTYCTQQGVKLDANHDAGRRV